MRSFHICQNIDQEVVDRVHRFMASNGLEVRKHVLDDFVERAKKIEATTVFLNSISDAACSDGEAGHDSTICTPTGPNPFTLPCEEYFESICDDALLSYVNGCSSEGDEGGFNDLANGTCSPPLSANSCFNPITQ